MKKCCFVFAAIASLAFAAAARADLLDYSLVADQVYTDSNLTTPIAGAISNNGTTVTLPAGTTSGYVVMAILATVNNGASVPISSDGISFAALNISGTAGNMGTGVLTNQQAGTGVAGAFVNDGTLGNASGNPGANVNSVGYIGAWWVNNWGSPVQAFALRNSTRPTEWAENFQATGSQGGSSEGNPLVIGKTGPYAASDFGGTYGENGPMFIALFSPPTFIASGDRLVSYSNPTTISSVGANGTATQPGTGAAAYLLGASGINATSATFILGEVDYQFSGAVNGGTASLQVTPADLRNTDFSYGSDFLVDGTQVLSQYLDSTTGSVGVVGTLAPVTVSVGVVPEPGTLALLTAGGAGLLGYAWRKRRRKAAGIDR